MKTRLAHQERLSFKIYFWGCFSNADYLNIIYLSIQSFGLIKSSLIILYLLFNGLGRGPS